MKTIIVTLVDRETGKYMACSAEHPEKCVVSFSKADAVADFLEMESSYYGLKFVDPQALETKAS